MPRRERRELEADEASSGPKRLREMQHDDAPATSCCRISASTGTERTASWRSRVAWTTWVLSFRSKQRLRTHSTSSPAMHGRASADRSRMCRGIYLANENYAPESRSVAARDSSRIQLQRRDRRSWTDPRHRREGSRSPGGSEPRDGDALVPVHVAHVDAPAARLVDRIAGEALRELLQGDPRLQAGERRPDAVVYPLTESQLRRNVAADVEAVRIRVLALVAVRGAEQEQDAIPRRHGAAVPFDVARDRADGVLRRRRPAQHLLDRAGDRAPVGEDAGVLVRVAREEHGGEAEQPGGRLAPGRAEQGAEADDLAIGEARRPAVVGLQLDVEEAADQPVVGPRAQLPDQPEPVTQRLEPRGDRTRRDGVRAGVARQRDVGPLAQLAPVGLGNAKQGEDHVHR